MKFIIENGIFDKIDNLCVGVVVAKGVDNSKEYPEIATMLNDSMALAEKRFLGKKVKEDSTIIPYREAFRAIGLNPNKYQCSVEAMFNRVAKGNKIPHINPLVDLNNAISLKHTLPMGTHDLSLSDKDIEMRYAKANDSFTPMGSEESETPDDGEVVYAVGDQVRTRRWAWRQSKYGMIGPKTSYVFFPIDGFVGFNDDEVRRTIRDLEQNLQKIFGCKTASGFVDKNHPSFEWNL